MNEKEIMASQYKVVILSKVLQLSSSVTLGAWVKKKQKKKKDVWGINEKKRNCIVKNRQKSYRVQNFQIKERMPQQMNSSKKTFILWQNVRC